MKNCKIIQDLLPNYVERLTTKETNEFIEEHLKDCTECQKVLRNMAEENKKNNENNFNKEVSYLKKYNNKLKKVKITLVAIIVIFLLVSFGNIIKNMVILNDIQNKVNKYKESNNYYMKVCYYEDDKINITEQYVKNDKCKSIINNIFELGNHKMISYFNRENKNLYINIQNLDGTKSKILSKNDCMGKLEIQNDTKTNNLWQLFVIAITTRIKTEQCNGVECYKLEMSRMIMNNNIEKWNQTQYIDKETGLLVRMMDEENISLIQINKENRLGHIYDYKYEFNNVKDDEFIEPDISEYKIQENK